LTENIEIEVENQPGFTLQIYQKAKDVSNDIWEKYNSRKHPFRSMNFYCALEKTFLQREYAYIEGKIGNKTKMFLITSLEPFDLNAFLPGFIKRFSLFVRKWKPRFFTLMMGMSGCLETSMEHWWFEKDFQLTKNVVEKLLDKIREVFPLMRVLVFRDFTHLDSSGQVLKKHLSSLGFGEVLNFPTCIINPENRTLEEHYNRLKRKARASVRRADRLTNENELKLEKLKIDEKSIEQIYPLYLQVHERAETFQRPPFPKEFFKEIMKQMEHEAHFLLVRDKNSKIEGFILGGISDRIYCPYMIGLNYEVASKYQLYRMLLWEAIKFAFHEGVQEIDMGITSYFIKQDYGSQLIDMQMFIKFYPTFVHKIMKYFLNKIFDAPQPNKRKSFKLSDNSR